MNAKITLTYMFSNIRGCRRGKHQKKQHPKTLDILYLFQDYRDKKLHLRGRKINPQLFHDNG